MASVLHLLNIEVVRLMNTRHLRHQAPISDHWAPKYGNSSIHQNNPAKFTQLLSLIVSIFGNSRVFLYLVEECHTSTHLSLGEFLTWHLLWHILHCTDYRDCDNVIMFSLWCHRYFLRLTNSRPLSSRHFGSFVCFHPSDWCLEIHHYHSLTLYKTR